ncbi:MAG: PAS domain S-box protein, partial [Bacteroidetes bacterium]|nr:PAS domain S-box protein [Bacteroidota bacterium]
MKISSKLFLGNSIYALIVVLICMGAITAFGILNNSIKETSSGTLQIFKTLEELKFNGLRIVSSTVEFVLIINEENGKKNPEGQKKTEKELVEMGINNSYSSLEKYLILIKKYSPEDSVYYKHINGILVRLINAGSEIINSKESGAGKSEILKEKEMFEKDEADFLAAVDDVLIKKESERKSKEDAIEASLKMSRDIILYTILFSFIVISIIWYMLKKSISLPISRLRDATIKLRGGNYDSSVVVSTNDEIGELSYSFNNMVNKLGETFENLNLEIKERKKVEIELQQSESRFRSLIEKSSEGICSIEKDGKMIYASPVGNKILGYENGGLTGFMMFEFIHPSDLQPTLIQLNKILEKPGSSISYQFRLKHKEGHYIWIRATATNLLEHPNLNAIVVNYHDISLRKEAEDKLIASEKRFREFADFLPQLVFEYDIKGAFTFANRASFEATGYTPDDIKKGFTVFNLIDPLQHQIVVEMMKKRLSKVPSNGTEYNIIRKDGSSFPAIAYASLVEENGEVKGIRGIVVDITERKKYELILKQNAAKLKLLNDIGSK